ncbi:hypothetical protein HDZ31DRAFT_46047 [Schizophyllum fasciatum]
MSFRSSSPAVVRASSPALSVKGGYLDFDDESTYAPSTFRGTWHKPSKSVADLDSLIRDEETIACPPNPRLLAREVNRIVGEDNTPHTTEIDTIPCAGLRIMHGPLKGLFAWRLVVRADGGAVAHSGQTAASSSAFPYGSADAVVANFVLDTASPYTRLAPETLMALRYTGGLRPGQAAAVTVQGVRSACVVGYPGEANSIGAPFVVDGSLTFYFDHRLDAPVLYGTFPVPLFESYNARCKNIRLTSYIFDSRRREQEAGGCEYTADRRAHVPPQCNACC